MISLRIQEQFASPRNSNSFTYTALSGLLDAMSPMSPNHA